MKKLLLIFMLLLPLTPNVLANDKVQGIIIELRSGERLEFMLSDNPKFFYEGENIIFKTNKIELKYRPNDIYKIKMEKVSDTSSIREVDAKEAIIQINSSFIRINTVKPSELVNVFSTSGVKIVSYKTSDSGNLEIPINTIPKGIHLIKVGNQSIKVSIK